MILALLACTGQTPIVATCPSETWPEDTCAPIFSDSALQDVHLTLSEQTWNALLEDYSQWEERAPDARKPYHPVESFRWGCDELTDAQIRLKGNPGFSWTADKLQFVVSFNKTDPDGRFQDLRKLGFDAPPYDPTLVSERVAFAMFSDMGTEHSCTGSVRLWINDQVYGTYTLMEMVDKEYLQRFYDGDDEGNLYKYDYGMAGMRLRTNEAVGDTSDLTQLYAVDTYAGVQAVYDLDQALRVWAGESIVLQADGYWAGSLNYYLYHHPDGWKVLPWDLDHAFDFWAPTIDPLFRNDFYGNTYHLDLVLEDPVGRQRFIDAVKSGYSAVDVDRTLDRLDLWAEHIRPSIEAEPHPGFTLEEHDEALEQLREAILARDAFLADWVDTH